MIPTYEKWRMVMRVLSEHELSNLIRYTSKLKKRTVVKKT